MANSEGVLTDDNRINRKRSTQGRCEMTRATTKQREDFVAAMVREFPDRRDIVNWCRQIMRHGTTHGRLAEALCNGDWPCDNGERKTKECGECGSGYAPSSFRKGVCPDCRCEALIGQVCATVPGVSPIFSGDPRGLTLKLKVPSGRTDDFGQSGICVPTS